MRWYLALVVLLPFTTLAQTGTYWAIPIYALAVAIRAEADTTATVVGGVAAGASRRTELRRIGNGEPPVVPSHVEQVVQVAFGADRGRLATGPRMVTTRAIAIIPSSIH